MKEENHFPKNNINDDFNIKNNDDLRNNIKINNIANIDNSNPLFNIRVRKNRTLQYYKFLFYSIKMEIKVTEFIDLIRFANQSEISLWIISLVLYESGYSAFIWLHILHLIRGLMGFLLLIKFPKSGDIIDQMALNKQDIENYIFNDLARKSIRIRIAEPLMSMKPYLIIYMLLTILNFCIDSLDFFYQLSKFDKTDEDLNGKVFIFVNFIIATLYLTIDLSYIFWGYTLKYTFPRNIMLPIYDLIGGWVDKIKHAFKLNKVPVDLKNEDTNNQSQNQNNRNDIRIDIDSSSNNNNISNSKNKFQNNFSKIVPISGMNDNINNPYDEKIKYHPATNN